jgi:hypothetical protein
MTQHSIAAQQPSISVASWGKLGVQHCAAALLGA